MKNKRTERGQALVYVAISITVIAFVVMYFLSQQAKDNAENFSEALQENYSTQVLELSLTDVVANGYTEGAVVEYNQWSYYCRDGRSDMEFPSMSASLPSFYGASCPTDAAGVIEALREIKKQLDAERTIHRWGRIAIDGMIKALGG